MIAHRLLDPVDDETFSSWAIRCALDPQVFFIADGDFVSWERSVAYDLASNPYSLGMEFDFDTTHAESFLGQAGLSKKLVRQRFGPSDDLLLSPAYRTAFCPECILSDVVSKRFPSWRKSWCYIARPYCQQHNCLLRFMNGCSVTDKQWSAFTKLDLGEYMPGRLSGRSKTDHGVPQSAVRAQLTIRIQNWIQKMYSSTSYSANRPMDNALIRTGINLMLMICLAQRTRRTQAGAAKTAFSCFSPPIDHDDSDLHRRLKRGYLDSVPYERMCALWLIGAALQVYTASEFSLLTRLVQEAEFSFPPTLGELGERCGSILAEGEGKVLADLILSLNVSRVFAPSFLEGLLGR